MMRPLWILFVSLCLVAPLHAAPADGVRVVQDVDYVDGADYADGKDELDLYLPEGRDGFPVVVFFHGGGLLRGDKSGSKHLGMALAAEGVGAAVVNYRLSPGVMHPAHAEDAARSIAWVHGNIERYRGNPDEIFLSGHSAGAYLAALLVLDSRYLEGVGMSPAMLAGSMPISGFFYVEDVAPTRPTSAEVWGAEEKDWRDASPSSYLRSDAMPLLLLYADGDDPWRRKQNEDFAAALEKQGSTDVSTRQIADRDHTGIHRSIGAGDPTLNAMLAFVRSH